MIMCNVAQRPAGVPPPRPRGVLRETRQNWCVLLLSHFPSDVHESANVGKGSFGEVYKGYVTLPLTAGPIRILHPAPLQAMTSVPKRQSQLRSSTWKVRRMRSRTSNKKFKSCPNSTRHSLPNTMALSSRGRIYGSSWSEQLPPFPVYLD